MTAELASAQDPGKIMMLIVQNDADIPDEACKAVWLRLARYKAIEPTHDIVTAVGRRHVLYQVKDPGTGWHEVSRSAAWYAHGVMQGDGEQSDRWLDAEGTIWGTASSQDLHLYANFTPEAYPFTSKARGEPNWIALPKGAAFRPSSRPGQEEWSPRNRQSAWMYVAGGVRLSRQPANNEFAKVAAAILRARPGSAH